MMWRWSGNSSKTPPKREDPSLDDDGTYQQRDLGCSA